MIISSLCQAWKRHNEILQEMASASQKQLTALKKDVQEVNWARKNQQTNVGEKLRQLEVNWVGLVSKNYEIEQALVNLESELKQLNEDEMGE